MAGHISVEKSPEARRVVESAFADTIFVEDVAEVGRAGSRKWGLSSWEPDRLARACLAWMWIREVPYGMKEVAYSNTFPACVIC